MSKNQSKPPMDVEPELEEQTAESAGRGSKEATDEELKMLVGQALMIEAIKRRQAKVLAAKDHPSKK